MSLSTLMLVLFALTRCCLSLLARLMLPPFEAALQEFNDTVYPSLILVDLLTSLVLELDSLLKFSPSQHQSGHSNFVALESSMPTLVSTEAAYRVRPLLRDKIFHRLSFWMANREWQLSCVTAGAQRESSVASKHVLFGTSSRENQRRTMIIMDSNLFARMQLVAPNWLLFV